MPVGIAHFPTSKTANVGRRTMDEWTLERFGPPPVAEAYRRPTWLVGCGWPDTPDRVETRRLELESALRGRDDEGPAHA